MSSDTKSPLQDALPLPSPSECRGEQQASVHNTAPLEGKPAGKAADAVSTEGDSMPGAISGVLAEDTAESSQRSTHSTLSRAAADLQPLASSNVASQDSRGAASAVSCRSETDADTAHIEGVSTAESASRPESSTEGLARQRKTGSSRVEAQTDYIQAAGVEGRPRDVHDKSKQPGTKFHDTAGESRAATAHEKAQKTDVYAKSRCSIC